MPTTVLAAQVAAGVYKDVYFGMNLRSIPGASYPIGENFSNLPMPADSPYRCGWWYRKQFDVPAAEPGGRFSLAVRRNQLFRRHLGQRYTHSRPVTGPRRIPHLRIRRYSGCSYRHEERRCGPGLCSHGKRPGDELGGLESYAPRQEHGTLVGCAASHWRTRCSAAYGSADALRGRHLADCAADGHGRSAQWIEPSRTGRGGCRRCWPSSLTAGQHSGWRNGLQLPFARKIFRSSG